MSEKLDIAWNENFRSFEKYYKTYGEVPSSGSSERFASGVGVYSWYASQKDLAKGERLAPYRLELMDGLLGKGWHLRNEANPEDYRVIPDNGRNYSISSMFRVGILSKGQYISLYKRGVRYIDDYLRCASRGNTDSYGLVTDSKLYELMKKDFSLPDLVYVRMYCVGVGKCLQHIFKEKSRVDIYGIQRMPENLRNISLVEWGDTKSTEIFIDWLGSDSFLIRDGKITGFKDTAKKYGMGADDVNIICKKVIQRLEMQKGSFVYNSDCQLLSPELSIVSLGLNNRMITALHGAGIRTVPQLVRIVYGSRTYSDVMGSLKMAGVPGVGIKLAKHLYAILLEKKLL